MYNEINQASKRSQIAGGRKNCRLYSRAVQGRITADYIAIQLFQKGPIY